jgi:hypothetical protein
MVIEWFPETMVTCSSITVTESIFVYVEGDSGLQENNLVKTILILVF